MLQVLFNIQCSIEWKLVQNNIGKICLINYLNKVEDNDTPSRFGSCNEYTFGINENIRPPSVPSVKKNENSESKQDPKSPHE